MMMSLVVDQLVNAATVSMRLSLFDSGTNVPTNGLPDDLGRPSSQRWIELGSQRSFFILLLVEICHFLPSFRGEHIQGVCIRRSRLLYRCIPKHVWRETDGSSSSGNVGKIMIHQSFYSSTSICSTEEKLMSLGRVLCTVDQLHECHSDR